MVLLAILVLLAAAAAAAQPAQIARHRIEATLDVPAHRIAVTDDVTLAAAPAPGEPWRFLLHRDLAIEEIRLDADAVAWAARDGWDPRGFWRRPPYAELGRFEVAREIEVEPPRAGWGEEPVLRIRYAGVVADSLHEPESAYGRSFETTSGRIVAEGAYLAGATFWVPWSGDDPFRFDLGVTGPAGWRVISEGALALDEAKGAMRATRWVSEQPMEEIHLIAGPYQVRSRDHRGISILAYCYESTGPDVTDPYLAAAGESIDRFAQLFGPYPFGKFALVENYWQTGFGMPSFTLLGDRVIRLPFIVHTSYPHEILHNWWGNGVYVAREGGNWCEGLTTYCADYMAKEREGEAAARDYRRTALTAYRDFAAAGGKDFALARFRERDSAATQAVGYGKTLMLFHMLRGRLGDGPFFAGLRHLYEKKRFQHAGWDDVRAAFETESGEPLGEWFAQWVERPGAAQLSLHDVAAEKSGERWIVRGEIQQAEPWFDVSVPVVVEGNGVPVSGVVACTAASTPFTFATDGAPARVAADPGFDLFRMLHADEVPPALSGVLGAKAVRIVVGESTAGALRDALVAVAKDWAKDSTVTVVEEGGALGAFDGGTWYFGRGRAADEFVAGLPEPPPVGGTFVGAGRVGGDPDRPAAVFLPEGPEPVAAIARKIPHYSKYGFLVFDGERNVKSGSWDTAKSPLVVELGR